jgi:hypothetical protein
MTSRPGGSNPFVPEMPGGAGARTELWRQVVAEKGV